MVGIFLIKGMSAILLSMYCLILENTYVGIDASQGIFGSISY